jgi:hypothetical protein
MNFFKRLFSSEKKETLNQGVEKTRTGLFSKLARIVVGKSTIDDEVLTEIRAKQNAFAKAKNELILSMKPFTWANNYMVLHSIKRFPLNNTPPITGNDIIENGGDNLPCGYSQNLNDCGSLDPFCGPNKQDDNDVC